MSLLGDVGRILANAGIAHALVGAAALAVHGVARSTEDVDLLCTSTAALEDALWNDLRAMGVAVETRRGDPSDPFAGVVRLRATGTGPVDLIVGRSRWQAEMLQRAVRTRFADDEVPVVTALDLLVLKLWAAGSQDAWDIDQLLDTDPSLVTSLEAQTDTLPEGCAELWRRILTVRASSRR